MYIQYLWHRFNSILVHGHTHFHKETPPNWKNFFSINGWFLSLGVCNLSKTCNGVKISHYSCPLHCHIWKCNMYNILVSFFDLLLENARPVSNFSLKCLWAETMWYVIAANCWKLAARNQLIANKTDWWATHQFYQSGSCGSRGFLHKAARGKSSSKARSAIVYIIAVNLQMCLLHDFTVHLCHLSAPRWVKN